MYKLQQFGVATDFVWRSVSRHGNWLGFEVGMISRFRDDAEKHFPGLFTDAGSSFGI